MEGFRQTVQLSMEAIRTLANQSKQEEEQGSDGSADGSLTQTARAARFRQGASRQATAADEVSQGMINLLGGQSKVSRIGSPKRMTFINMTLRCFARDAM